MDDHIWLIRTVGGGFRSDPDVAMTSWHPVAISTGGTERRGVARFDVVDCCNGSGLDVLAISAMLEFFFSFLH